MRGAPASRRGSPSPNAHSTLPTELSTPHPVAWRNVTTSVTADGPASTAHATEATTTVPTPQTTLLSRRSIQNPGKITIGQSLVITAAPNDNPAARSYDRLASAALPTASATVTKSNRAYMNSSSG